MSTQDPIDLRVRSQVVFHCSHEDLFKNSALWCVFDENRNIINMSESFPSFFFSLSNQCSQFPFKSNIVFLQNEDSPVFIPYQIFESSIVINSTKLYCLYLNKYEEISLDLLLIDDNNFYYKDNFGNKLMINDTLSILKDINLFKKISQKDWLIAWLIIHDFTTERISLYLNQKPNSIDISIRRFLGVKKLELFDRELFKKVARILGWYAYIPASIVYKNAVKTTVYKDILVKGAYTKKIFKYTHSELN